MSKRISKNRTNHSVKLCYCDESGTGGEQIATMAGVIVDSKRMHITKQHWQDLLEQLNRMTGRCVPEIHTKHLYKGRSIWHEVDGSTRANIISVILKWLQNRKHYVVFSSVVEKLYSEKRAKQDIPADLDTIWKFMGFHIILAIQKCHQRERSNKGHTLFVFDNEERERSCPEVCGNCLT